VSHLLLLPHYCPKDRRQLRRLVDVYPELEVGYTRIALISTDTVMQSHEHRAGLGAQWPFLADPGRIVQKDLNIQEYTDPHHDPMIPHTLVLKAGLEIVKIYNGYWYWGRPSIEELRADVREIRRSISPDWDLAAPGLREAWERGERDRFFPYETSTADLLRASS